MASSNPKTGHKRSILLRNRTILTHRSSQSAEYHVVLLENHSLLIVNDQITEINPQIKPLSAEITIIACEGKLMSRFH